MIQVTGTPGRDSRPRCASILMEAVAKSAHGAYVAAFGSICTHLAAKCAFHISRTNQYDFSIFRFRLNDHTKQPKVHVRSLVPMGFAESDGLL